MTFPIIFIDLTVFSNSVSSYFCRKDTLEDIYILYYTDIIVTIDCISVY